MRGIARRISNLACLAYARVGHRLAGIDFVARLVSRVGPECTRLLLTRYGALIGPETRFKDGIQIDNASGDQDARDSFENLVIGSRCYVGKGCFFDLPDRIVIEDEAVLSAGVKVLTHADCGDRVMSRYYPRKREPVRIGAGSWIGVDAIVLCGVELGRCCVVAAGSVVNKSFPDYSVVAGSPARLVKTLAQDGEATSADTS